jgi:hypothetical protein
MPRISTNSRPPDSILPRAADSADDKRFGDARSAAAAPPPSGPLPSIPRSLPVSRADNSKFATQQLAKPLPPSEGSSPSDSGGQYNVRRRDRPLDWSVASKWEPPLSTTASFNSVNYNTKRGAVDFSVTNNPDLQGLKSMGSPVSAADRSTSLDVDDVISSVQAQSGPRLASATLDMLTPAEKRSDISNFRPGGDPKFANRPRSTSYPDDKARKIREANKRAGYPLSDYELKQMGLPSR